MHWLNRLGSGWVLTLVTLAAVVILAVISGGKMFSPGALNAQGRASRTLGGVRSHAEIGGNCAACHAAPWSGETMTTRCLKCHWWIHLRQEPAHLVKGLQFGRYGLYEDCPSMSRFL